MMNSNGLANVMSGVSPQAREMMAQLPGRLGNLTSDKNKNAPQEMSPMVPQAQGGFNQRIDPSQRTALLQAMMQRSRAGRQMGA